MTVSLYKIYTPPYERVQSTMYGGDPLGGYLAASAQQLSYDDVWTDGWVANHTLFNAPQYTSYEVSYADPADNPFKDLENYELDNPGWYLAYIRVYSNSSYPKSLTIDNSGDRGFIMTLPNTRVGALERELNGGGPATTYQWNRIFGLNDTYASGCAFSGIDGYVRGSDLAGLLLEQRYYYGSGYADPNQCKIYTMKIEVWVTDVPPTILPQFNLPQKAMFQYRRRRV